MIFKFTMGSSLKGLEVFIRNTFDKVKKFQEDDLGDCLSDELIQQIQIISIISKNSNLNNKLVCNYINNLYKTDENHLSDFLNFYWVY
tara:strand:+ start:130 stop:393 length:264 start_codon:yes stop_codon:yes gene_type:complete